MKDTGKKISNMEGVWKHGQTEQAMKEIMLKAKNMGLVNSHGQTRAPITVNLWRIILMGKVI